MINSPGLSAYNKVEIRMFHLSKPLTGVVLPADTYGSHLSNGKTVDDEFEMKHFKAAREALIYIWGNLVIDGHDVKAKYIEESASEDAKQFNVTPYI